MINGGVLTTPSPDKPEVGFVPVSGFSYAMASMRFAGPYGCGTPSWYSVLRMMFPSSSHIVRVPWISPLM